MNLKKYYYHFIGGSKTGNDLINFELSILKSIFNTKAILSRNKQLQILGYYNEGFNTVNHNGFDYISICKYNPFNDYENTFEYFKKKYSICIILKSTIIDELILHEDLYIKPHMCDELQIKDIIPIEYFKGIGIILNQYYKYKTYINEDDRIKRLKNDIALYEKVKSIILPYDLPIFELNFNIPASEHIEKCMKLIKTR